MNLFYFLHSSTVDPIALSIGRLDIRWYGIMIALAILAALLVSLKLAAVYKFKKEMILDLASYLIIGGLIGARLYDVLLELPYYIDNPLAVLKIWQGGLAIHGALIGGLLALFLYVRSRKVNAWQLMAVVLPGLALAQAIGRWGNWFNQELFGLPSTLPWSIPIDFAYRPRAYEAITYFHPTFLYESLAMLLVFGLLYYLAYKKKSPYIIIGVYLMFYGLIRFLLEFIKIDTTPIVLGLRWPQIFSLAMMVGAMILFANKKSEAV